MKKSTKGTTKGTKDGTKDGAKRSPPSKKAVRDAEAASRAAVSLDDLDEKKVKKRLRSIYDLEREVENKRVARTLHASALKIAKTELASAEEALAGEIKAQQDGPGPLFKGSQ